MKALVSNQPGGPESLIIAEMPDPLFEEGELLVSVAACGINYPDVLIIEDRYQFKPARPFAPGSEVAGTVIAVGDNVTGWKAGDRMIGTMLGSGGMAEKARVKASAAFHLPDQFDFVSGSALLLTYSTAIHALKDRGHLTAGETLLILGAAGGVGLAAIEIGRAMGARVIAAVSSEAKKAAALAAGAHDALVYSRETMDADAGKALAARFKEAVGPAGADVVLDPVGGDYAEPALRSIAWQGRYLVVGFPAGIPKFALNLILIKGCAVVGVFQGAFGERDPEANAKNVEQLFNWWSEGLITPKVTDTYPLEQGGLAISHLAERGAVGKLVVKIGQDA